MSNQNQLDAQITEEMVNYFNIRTAEHINRVKNNMILMEGYQNLDIQSLIKRGEIHDQSKLAEPERQGYIWLTWWHYCKKQGINFDYPEGAQDLVQLSVDHHLKSNLHHPECHQKSNDMSWLDIVEMVCDWTAMSQEYNQGSCLSYVQQNIQKWHFNEQKTKDIFDTISEIDKRLQKNI
ncbi:hypothetical protein TTHERM_00492640 (macronuclear) [Tetrahymena thermophila SB210]|uniref:Uncharacterized protein n=1 Tax=Tetrahymena thermophila (strain SB210) TaxID=312017 RepID=I7M9V8_TETTS|nr:hypothetical protein TTHERM_00492640 [Tetrahymena thermophila SB210]EAS02911.1 hypothetical protein TTHERM_00492640 [Tetrahymena thermophila SB210]|eukprot:XP_001023156.1 hypothetical protein TTHERM_00492640 [Tetrahymena thermophila SB210]